MGLFESYEYDINATTEGRIVFVASDKMLKDFRARETLEVEDLVPVSSTVNCSKNKDRFVSDKNMLSVSKQYCFLRSVNLNIDTELSSGCPKRQNPNFFMTLAFSF